MGVAVETIKSTIRLSCTEIKDRYKKAWNRNTVSTLFITIMFVFFAVFVAAMIMTGGDSFYYSLWHDRRDVFMDHFNSVVYSLDHPNYPPLAILFYYVFNCLTVPFLDPAHTGGFDIRDSQMGMLSFLIMTLLTFYLLHILFRILMKKTNSEKEGGTGIRTEVLFLLIVVSFPFIFALERGNSIILTLVFCLAFLMGYRSENRIVRYASYIALGCAVGFKLTPAILWLLIIRERRYMEAGICAVVAVLSFVPFALIIPDMLEHNIVATSILYPGTGGFFNLYQLASMMFGEILGLEEGITATISTVIVLVFTLLSSVVVLFAKNMKFWKIVALLCCTISLGFGIPGGYMLIYLSIPLMFFIATEKKMTKNNLFYLICFIMVIALMPVMEKWYYFNTSIRVVFVIIVAVALISEGLLNIYRNWRMRSRSESAELLANT
ncbi:MAG: DUF2029 domain-containing protein [Methanomassiliicoccaceae archaeon]|jgi:hypothetical protein|nr:DUF2029 domain-containing protein [Methanomassiliicoccaceae archaeon]